MNNDMVLVVTSLGRALMEKPQGRITGDARLLMGMIDGRATIAEISSKVPPTVRAKLPDIFARLMHYGVVEEIGDSVAGPVLKKPKSLSEMPPSEPAPGAQRLGEERRVPGNAGIENKRRVELEKELQEMRSRLEATIERQRKVEEDYQRLTRQVSAYTEAGPASGEQKDAQRGPENGMRKSLDNMRQLNDVLIEQEEILDNTLKLRAYEAKLNTEQHEREHDVGETRLAHAHPHYKSLRGLEFFKGFSNAELLDFLTVAKWQEAEAGETILSEGDIGISFYIVVSGSVNVYRKGTLLKDLERGDFFGEFAYLSGEEPVRSARVVAGSACSLLAVDPLDIEFSHVQLRLRVVEALLRGQVKRAMLADQRIDALSNRLEHSPHESR